MKYCFGRLSSWWFATMTPPTAPLTTIHQRETLRKRRLLSSMIVVSTLLIMLSTTAASLIAYTPQVSIGWMEFSALLLALWLNRRGHLQLASLFLFLPESCNLLFAAHTLSLSNPISLLWTLSPMALLLVIAGLFLPAWMILVMAAVETLVVLWYLLIERHALLTSLLSPQERWSFLIYLVGVISTSAMIGTFYTITTKKALMQADRAVEIEQAHQALSMAHSDLEQAHTKIQHQALTDPLTGLPNHGAILDRIETKLQQCQSSQRHGAIIFVDVDHFKRINDTWGHAAGDAALREVGQRLRAGIREDDCIGRYGGEEFALLLSDIEQPEAFDLAERLRYSIASTPCLWQQEGTHAAIRIPLIASFGLATYPLDGFITKELLEMADSAMYMAKQSGRNRVCLSDEVDITALKGNKNQQGPQYSEQSIVQTISTMAALHDQDTQAHADRMIWLAEATMHALGRSEDEIALLRLAAQLHDIGKIGIPEAILQKPGPLSEEEWDIMRQHPQIAQQILTPAKGQFGLVSHIVVAHHERWDGQGYPYKLAQQEIPLGARILSVVDSYDAMISSRPYREALSAADAREELLRCAGSQFDPQVVEAFLRVLDAGQQSSVPALREKGQAASLHEEVVPFV